MHLMSATASLAALAATIANRPRQREIPVIRPEPKRIDLTDEEIDALMAGEPDTPVRGLSRLVEEPPAQPSRQQRRAEERAKFKQWRRSVKSDAVREGLIGGPAIIR